MKFQYLVEIVFIRLTLKTSVSPNLKLSLLLQKGSNQPEISPGCSLQLQCRRLQRKFDLSSLDPFHFTLSNESTEPSVYSLSLTDDQNSQKPVSTFQIPLESMISDFQQLSKVSFQENYEGKLINLQYKVSISKKQNAVHEKISLNLINPNGEQLQMMRNSSRHKRPPELNIQTKNKLRASTVGADSSQRAKSQRISKGTDATPEHQKKDSRGEESAESKIKENQNWEIFSALPEVFTNWMKKKKSKRQKEEHLEIEQVKELLMSHHPADDHHIATTKLSIKLKVVIGLLIIGFFFLIADMFKNKQNKKVNKKPISHRSHKDKHHNQGEKHKTSVKKEAKRGKGRG